MSISVLPCRWEMVLISLTRILIKIREKEWGSLELQDRNFYLALQEFLASGDWMRQIDVILCVRSLGCWVL